MDSANHRFGRLTLLRADAIGPPGQRRFHIQAEGESGWAELWLEKEQLYSLAVAIVRLLAQQGASEAETASSPARPGPMPVINSNPSLEINVGRLALGYDEESKQFLILAHEIESAADALPTFSAWVNRTQVEEFSREAFAVCAAGRPLCPLCHAPLGPEPHVCPKSNGHGDMSQELEAESSAE
jgi:uncharacterized repeat protein (TIGR03847 family)